MAKKKSRKKSEGVYNSCPPSCCSEPQCAHIQLSPFYHLSTLDVTHVRKDTRPSMFFMQPKTRGPGNEANKM